jgi:23S rRNA (uracil1939-C5)-methyltransferase
MKKEYSKAVVSIEKLSVKGRGVGSIQKEGVSFRSKAVIPLGLPGEEVLAEIGTKKQGAYQGRLLEVIKPSPHRIPLKCKHALVCGGCSLQQMDYTEQLNWKELEIRKLFGEVSSNVFRPIIGASFIWHYRNKMEFSFSQDKEGNRYLGLMKVGARGRVETINECQIAPAWCNQVLVEVLSWWEQSSLAAYHPYADTGTLRTLTLREGERSEEKMAILTVSGRAEFAIGQKDLNLFVEAIKRIFGEEKLSVFLRIHQAIAGQPTQFYEMQLFGKDHIEEKLTIAVGDYTKDYSFKISPTAFFQPNTKQAEQIYAQALGLAGLHKRKRVFDLYAGTATLGMIFAPFAEKVLSVEINPYAVFDAQSNKEINSIDNLEIIQGDVAEVLKTQLQKDPSLALPDLILVDPPRVGLGTKALEILLELKAKEILYISCAPSSQAQDCKRLQEAGYEILAIQPIDQFPHTVHVENIILLRRV